MRLAAAADTPAAPPPAPRHNDAPRVGNPRRYRLHQRPAGRRGRRRSAACVVQRAACGRRRRAREPRAVQPRARAGVRQGAGIAGIWDTAFRLLAATSYRRLQRRLPACASNSDQAPPPAHGRRTQHPPPNRSKFAALKALDLSRVSRPIPDDSFTSALASLAGLTRLVIAGPGCAALRPEALAPVGRLARLRCLTLQGCRKVGVTQSASALIACAKQRLGSVHAHQ